MTSDYTIMWKVNSSEYLLDTNITWCLIVEKIDLMNPIISWHAQKRESRVGRSSLLIHSYIRFIHPKTVLCIPLPAQCSTCVSVGHYPPVFPAFQGHMPSLVGHPERMPRPFQRHSPTTKNDVRHLWYSRLWMVWFQGILLLHRFDHSGLPLWGSHENEGASHLFFLKYSMITYIIRYTLYPNRDANAIRQFIVRW